MVDDRLQRPMRKLVRERNGIRVLVGLLRYRRQVSMADAVRLRATLCLLGLAHDVQIAQVLEKMRITTTLSDTVRGGPVVDRWVGRFRPFWGPYSGGDQGVLVSRLAEIHHQLPKLHLKPRGVCCTPLVVLGGRLGREKM